MKTLSVVFHKWDIKVQHKNKDATKNEGFKLMLISFVPRLETTTFQGGVLHKVRLNQTPSCTRDVLEHFSWLTAILQIQLKDISYPSNSSLLSMLSYGLSSLGLRSCNETEFVYTNTTLLQLCLTLFASVNWWERTNVWVDSLSKCYGITAHGLE